MKKVLALGTMVVCLGLFSLGCEQQSSAPAPSAPPAPQAGTTDAAPADEAKPADEKPAEEAKPADAKPAE